MWHLFLQYYHEKACSHCLEIPKESSICLLCGTIVCLKGRCCFNRNDSSYEASKVRQKHKAIFAGTGSIFIDIFVSFEACGNLWWRHWHVPGSFNDMHYRDTWRACVSMGLTVFRRLCRRRQGSTVNNFSLPLCLLSYRFHQQISMRFFFFYRRGKPLYLSRDRFNLLESQWLAHRFAHTKHMWVLHRNSL